MGGFELVYDCYFVVCCCMREYRVIMMLMIMIMLSVRVLVRFFWLSIVLFVSVVWICSGMIWVFWLVRVVVVVYDENVFVNSSSRLVRNEGVSMGMLMCS